MKSDMASGYGQADLTLNFKHHDGGVKSKVTWKDLQVASAEFVGTFFLALYVSATKITTSEGSAPFAIGLGLVALVYTTGQISGGQLNPAVTIGLVTRNKLNLYEACYCLIAQFSGAVIAGLVCYALYNEQWEDVGYPNVVDSHRRTEAFFGEMIQTFALVTVVLNTATTKAQSNNSYFGVAIGFVVLSGALVIGGITGACFNPSLSMLTLLHGDFGDVWVFLFGPGVGGMLAGLVFRVTNPSEWDEATDPLAKPLGNIIRAAAPVEVSHRNPDGSITRAAAMLTQEFIGTFFLNWTVAMTANINLTGGYIAVGAILTSMVYAGGAISGGHYNPAVTLGVYLRGLFENQQSMRAYDCLLYVVVQILAAFAAGSAASYVNGGYDSIASPTLNTDKHTIFACLSVEFLFSFLLVLTVLNAATSSKVSGNSYFGLAIGFVLTSGGITVGDFTGGCFNPAVAVALSALTGRGVKNIWVYVLGEVLGAVAAAGLFTFWHLGDEDADNSASDLRNSGQIFEDAAGGHNHKEEYRTVLLNECY